MARVGLLFLRNGVWSSGPVVSQSFVDTVRVPHPSIASATNADPAGLPQRDHELRCAVVDERDRNVAERAARRLLGMGPWDSLIVVIPSLDVVAVRAGTQNLTPSAGRTWNDSDWNGDYAVLAPFLDPIVQSITP